MLGKALAEGGESEDEYDSDNFLERMTDAAPCVSEGRYSLSRSPKGFRAVHLLRNSIADKRGTPALLSSSIGAEKYPFGLRLLRPLWLGGGEI